MKKIMLGLVTLLVFQLCTSELSEINGVIGEHIDSDPIEIDTETNTLVIPAESFLVQYFATNTKNNISIATRVENRISHDFNSPLKTDLGADELSAKWTGDFYFEAGDYVFSINSNLGITVQIDDEIILEEKEMKDAKSYEIKQQLDGVHRLIVEYNINNTAAVDTIENSALNEPIVEVDNGTPTVVVDWKKDVIVIDDPHYINGIVTAEELAIWRSRAQNGPYKSKNDYSLNSPDNWETKFALKLTDKFSDIIRRKPNSISGDSITF